MTRDDPAATTWGPAAPQPPPEEPATEETAAEEPEAGSENHGYRDTKREGDANRREPKGRATGNDGEQAADPATVTGEPTADEPGADTGAVAQNGHSGPATAIAEQPESIPAAEDAGTQMDTGRHGDDMETDSAGATDEFQPAAIKQNGHPTQKPPLEPDADDEEADDEEADDEEADDEEAYGGQTADEQPDDTDPVDPAPAAGTNGTPNGGISPALPAGASYDPPQADAEPSADQPRTQTDAAQHTAAHQDANGDYDGEDEDDDEEEFGPPPVPEDSGHSEPPPAPRTEQRISDQGEPPSQRYSRDDPGTDQPSSGGRSRYGSDATDDGPATEARWDRGGSAEDGGARDEHRAAADEDQNVPAPDPMSEPGTGPSAADQAPPPHARPADAHTRSALGRTAAKLPFARKLFAGKDGEASARSLNGHGKMGTRAPAPPDAARADIDAGYQPDTPGAPPDPGPEDEFVAQPSEEEVEQRLMLALRETMVDGFSRIAVGSPKGGVGKSSIAYAVAGAIAYFTNIRVCLVDADPDFGATRLLVPRPIDNSIIDLARDADDLYRLSDIRRYTAQNERMRVDVVLGAPNMSDKGAVPDLPEAYRRIDEVLSRVYDVVIYDMGLGFSHPQIQAILGFSDELLIVGDSEVVPNAMLPDALTYLERELGVEPAHTTLCINHRQPAADESADTEAAVRGAAARKLRRITQVPYDPAFSQLLNRRAMHVEDLALKTRLGVLTTAGSSLEGLRAREGSATDAGHDHGREER